MVYREQAASIFSRLTLDIFTIASVSEAGIKGMKK